MTDQIITSGGVVALLNASDDTIDIVKALLTISGAGQRLVSCHFADLKKGKVHLDTFLAEHNPEVVIFDISPPYDENWHFFKTMRDADAMRGRGAVLTTTNKRRLDEVVREDSFAIEVVGRSEDLHLIRLAIVEQTAKARSTDAAIAQV